jgi:curli production assembly/transport component CsgG
MPQGIFRIVIPLLALVLTSCGAYFSQPYTTQDARIGELASKTQVLRDMPAPYKELVVGVYNFKDQTGQYKAQEGGSTFSTAVSQGATTMLIQALEDSKWFTPIERENLGNLLNERNIIRSTRDEFGRSTNRSQPALPPLLYAGILLEGGIVSYDTNIITGGAGARYFGAGASTKYRQDRISVYLRAVSTSNGKILKTVYVSKTILSQSIDASLFRYVSFQRLLEAETGFTKNEPIQLAMKDAIEKSVEALIVEGIAEGLWTSAEGGLTNKRLMDAYKIQKEYEESQLLYDRKQTTETSKDAITVSGTSSLLNGDLGNKTLAFGGSFGYLRTLSPKWALALSVDYLNLKGGKSFSREAIATQLNLELNLLPYDNLAPFVYGGAGVVFDVLNSDNLERTKITAPKVQLGAGMNYRASNKIDIRLVAESNFTFSDELDGIVSGKRDDFYYNFGLGLKFKLGSQNRLKNNISKEKSSEDKLKKFDEIENPKLKL